MTIFGSGHLSRLTDFTLVMWTPSCRCTPKLKKLSEMVKIKLRLTRASDTHKDTKGDGSPSWNFTIAIRARFVCLSREKFL